MAWTDGDPAGIWLVCCTPSSVDRLPGNRHRHHRRFARTRCKLQRQTHNLRLGIMALILKMVKEPFRSLSCRLRHLGEPYRSFNHLNLAEERADTVERMTPPMLKQSGSFGRQMSSVRVWQRPPLAHLMADSIDQRSLFILLRLIESPSPSFKHYLLLLR